MMTYGQHSLLTDALREIEEGTYDGAKAAAIARAALDKLKAPPARVVEGLRLVPPDTPPPTRLLSYGDAPGYRDVSVTVDVKGKAVDITLAPRDAESVMLHIMEVHRRAWRTGEPLDMEDGESRPRWL